LAQCGEKNYANKSAPLLLFGLIREKALGKAKLFSATQTRRDARFAAMIICAG
jgi:hypothetical protein